MSEKEIEDLCGKKFNGLFVLEFSHFDKKRNSYWICLCDCGLTSIIRGSHLKSGHSKRCLECRKEKLKKSKFENVDWNGQFCFF